MVSGLPWGVALVSGVNTYLPLFMLALFARFSNAVHLSPRFEFLVSDQALIVLGSLAACEILAQKFPVLDNVWDALHTLLRPIAGAIAAGAAVDTDHAFEMVLAMLMGGTLAAAAHSAKSGARLVSTTKGFGVANVAMSFAEDGTVVLGTLLSIYAPWVMLGMVILFILIFVLFGPRLVRTLFFNLRMMTGWLGWVIGRLLKRPQAARLEESLLGVEPDHLKALNAQLEPGEELQGAIEGWQKTRGGPRAGFWLFTSRRLLLVERRMFRSPKVTPLAYRDISVARFRRQAFAGRVELLTRQNLNYTLYLQGTYRQFGAMAVQKISESAGLPRDSNPQEIQVGHLMAGNLSTKIKSDYP
jgi:Domain of unknown function (DUF4126)